MASSKYALKKQLQALGINVVEGNYIKKSEIGNLLEKYKVEANDANYYTDQINSILTSARDSEYLPTIQIRHEGKVTKNLNISLKGLEDLIASYKKHGTAESALKTYNYHSNIKRSNLIKFIDDVMSDKAEVKPGPIQIEFVNSKGLLQIGELDTYDDKQIRVDGLHFGIDLEKIDGVGVEDVWYGIVPPAKEK
jgi:hypothetical protein